MSNRDYLKLVQSVDMDPAGQKDSVKEEPIKDENKTNESQSWLECVATAVKDNPLAAVVGAVVGVGAVAAAPFTGGGSVLGAASLLASLTGAGGIAAAAGVAGAGIGVAVSQSRSDSGEKTAYDKGVQHGEAKSAIKIRRLEQALAKASAAFKDQQLNHAFIVNVAAIGFAMAACDGPVSLSEGECVEDFATGISRHALPAVVRTRLAELKRTPPDFEGALRYAAELKTWVLPGVDALLEVVSEADDDPNDKESAFLERWRTLVTPDLEEGAVA